MNVFNDFGSGEKGDIITLVRLLDKCDFERAVNLLLWLDGPSRTFSFSGNNRIGALNSSHIEVLGASPIVSLSLLRYVRSRAISEGIAKKYLKEVRYRNGERIFFALGFPNDSGGFELRSEKFKGKTGNGITTIPGSPSGVNLFEGFFDFLSACEYYQIDKPNNTTIVLNSTVNLSIALPFLEAATLIRSFLDNDKTGRKTLSKLQNAGFSISDESQKLFPNSNDFNEFLCLIRYRTVTNRRQSDRY